MSLAGPAILSALKYLAKREERGAGPSETVAFENVDEAESPKESSVETLSYMEDSCSGAGLAIPNDCTSAKP